MARRPTAPIPPHLIERFFQIAWDLASGSDHAYLSPDVRVAVKTVGRARTVRRHALACLWLTACGLRFSELRRLRVVDVSEGGYSAFIARSKGGLSGRVDLSKRLVGLTFDWRSENAAELQSHWLIPTTTGGQLSANAFNRDACGLFRDLLRCPLTSHCFRDTACQLAIVQGADVRVVQRLLGHRSAITTEHYLRKQDARAFQLGLFEGGVAS